LNRDRTSGDIARTYFYMDTAYPGRGIISEKNRKLLRSGIKKIEWMPGNASGYAALSGCRVTRTRL
jgi:hypothetical protein